MIIMKINSGWCNELRYYCWVHQICSITHENETKCWKNSWVCVCQICSQHQFWKPISHGRFGAHWLYLLFVSRIQKAAIFVIIVIMSRSLHGAQKFLYLRGCHVKDALTCIELAIERKKRRLSQCNSTRTKHPPSHKRMAWNMAKSAGNDSDSWERRHWPSASWISSIEGPPWATRARITSTWPLRCVSNSAPHPRKRLRVELESK